MSEDSKHWIEKGHYLVAVWPAEEDGSFSEHHNWRSGIVHADSEEEIMMELGRWMVPSATPFRLWIMELTAENARTGTITITTNFETE